MNVLIESCQEVISTAPPMVPYMDRNKQYLCIDCPKFVFIHVYSGRGEKVMLFGTSRAYFQDDMKIALYDVYLERFEELVPRPLIQKDFSKIIVDGRF